MVPQAQGIAPAPQQGDQDERNPSTDQLFLEITRRHMPSVETLETRNRDALDFHDVAVWSIRNSLTEAYAAGEAAAKRSKKRH
jgi:hypothetical protein